MPPHNLVQIPRPPDYGRSHTDLEKTCLQSLFHPGPRAVGESPWSNADQALSKPMALDAFQRACKAAMDDDSDDDDVFTSYGTLGNVCSFNKGKMSSLEDDEYSDCESLYEDDFDYPEIDETVLEIQPVETAEPGSSAVQAPTTIVGTNEETGKTISLSENDPAKAEVEKSSVTTVDIAFNGKESWVHDLDSEAPVNLRLKKGPDKISPDTTSSDGIREVQVRRPWWADLPLSDYGRRVMIAASCRDVELALKGSSNGDDGDPKSSFFFQEKILGKLLRQGPVGGIGVITTRDYVLKLPERERELLTGETRRRKIATNKMAIRPRIGFTDRVRVGVKHPT